MRTWVKKAWPVLKVLFAAALLAAIGRRFAADLRAHPDLWQRCLRPGWLFVCGALYLAGLAFSALFWGRLLHAFKQHPSALTVLRAYYAGHLGKYLPGKAWALLLRVTLVQGPEVRPGIAAVTAFYEVLTTMASGVLVAAVLFAAQGPGPAAGFSWEGFKRLLLLREPQTSAAGQEGLLFLTLLLLAATGIPILPAVFNRVVGRLSVARVAAPAEGKAATPFPRLRVRDLGEGLLTTACGWLLIGTSLLVLVHAMVPGPLPWPWAAWGRCTAFVDLAYVAGFVIIIVPGGLGVREFFLTLFLVPELAAASGESEARAAAVVVVVLLRLVWTAAEVLAAGLLYAWPGRRVGDSSRLDGARL